MRGYVTRCGLAVVLLAMTVLCSGPAVAEQTQIPPEEYAALVALYEATDGANWTNTWTLPTDDPCGLYGVTCSNGRITALRLGYNGLAGSIPPDIGDLTAMEYLDLDANALTGAIPAELGQMSDLLSLELDHNALSGSIPPELGELSNLQYLGIGFNEIEGPIPSQLGNLSALEVLHCPNNNLSGEIPSELGGLSALRGLFLNTN